MRNLIITCAVLLCTTALFAHAESSTSSFAQGYILMKPKAGVSDTKLAALLARFNGTSISFDKKLEKLGITMLKVPLGSELAFSESLGAQTEIEFAEPDYILEPAEFVPNDPGYANQWHLQAIRGPEAWENSTGNGVVVAVIDTGVDGNHPDLLGRALPGKNIVSDNDNTGDVMGHGTAVAGTLAAIGNNEIGIASVAHDAQILPVRISEDIDGIASFSDMAAGIIWAAENDARIANLSYAAANSATVQSAAKYMRNLGGLVFVAAGNDGTDPGWPNFPDLIVVSATDASDALADFSNYGEFVDISAPGDLIYTTTKDGKYATLRGTSFASPIAAGVAALIFAQNPDVDPGVVAEIMQQTAVDLGDEGWDPAYGAGRIDAVDALVVADNTDPSDTIDPTAILLGPSDGEIVTGSISIGVITEDKHTVLGVDLYVDNVPVATDFDPPYEFLWDSDRYANGRHSISAQARDAAGNIGESANPTVVIGRAHLDDAGPKITISNPPHEAAVDGIIEVSAFATDKNGVGSIKLVANGKMLCAGAPNVSCEWDTRNLKIGDYIITAKATDSRGNIEVTSIDVTVVKRLASR